MGGSVNMVSEVQKATSIRFQSSMFGGAVPVLHGQAAVSPNLLDYSNFTALRHERKERVGGKGGGGSTQTTVWYTYTADIVMGLCEGQVWSVGRMWRGKTEFPDLIGCFLNDGGIALYKKGEIGQTVHASLTEMNTGTKAIGYSGLAAIWVQDYNLGETPQVENHRFEVAGLGAFVIDASVPDAPCDLVLEDWIESERVGLGQAGVLGSLTSYSQYAVAAGIWISPYLQEQQPAADRLQMLERISNSALVEVDGLIHMVPLAGEDVSITVGASTYSWTANPVPQYELDPDHLLPRGKDEPLVSIKRTSGADAYNVVEVEFRARPQDYAPQVARKVDQASIDVYGEKPAPKLVCEWIADPAVADRVAQFELNRHLSKRNTYRFELPWNFATLVPTAIVTLTVPDQDLDQVPVRITRIEETETGYVCEAEDYIGTLGAQPVHVLPVISSFRHDYAAAPGATNVHAVFEAPKAIVDGLEVWLALSGSVPAWGGCHIWVSADGDNYRQVATFVGTTRVAKVKTAALSTDNTLAVKQANDQLGSGSALDAALNATLCWVGGEYVSYQAATLTGTGEYALSGVIRGLYGTRPVPHVADEVFVRCDGGLGKIQDLGLQMVGRQVWIKCQSFNVHGLATEEISAVTPVTYTITGGQALLPDEQFNLVPQGKFSGLPLGQRPDTWADGQVVAVTGQPFARALSFPGASVLGLEKIAAVVGDVFYGTAWLRSTASVSGTFGLAWFDASDTLLGSSQFGSTHAAGAAWAQHAGTVTASLSGVAYARPIVQASAAAGGTLLLAEAVVVRQAATVDIKQGAAANVVSTYLASGSTDALTGSPTTSMPVVDGADVVIHVTFDWSASRVGFTTSATVRGRFKVMPTVLKADGSAGSYTIIGGSSLTIPFGEVIPAGQAVSRKVSASLQARITEGATLNAYFRLDEQILSDTLAAQVAEALMVVEGVLR